MLMHIHMHIYIYIHTYTIWVPKRWLLISVRSLEELFTCQRVINKPVFAYKDSTTHNGRKYYVTVHIKRCPAYKKHMQTDAYSLLGQVWDCASGQNLKTFTGHRGPVACVRAMLRPPNVSIRFFLIRVFVPQRMHACACPLHDMYAKL